MRARDLLKFVLQVPQKQPGSWCSPKGCPVLVSCMHWGEVKHIIRNSLFNKTFHYEDNFCPLLHASEAGCNNRKRLRQFHKVLHCKSYAMMTIMEYETNLRILIFETSSQTFLDDRKSIFQNVKICESLKIYKHAWPNCL